MRRWWTRLWQRLRLGGRGRPAPLAAGPGRPAGEAVAEQWVRTRDPALRAAVLDSGAVAAPDPDFRPVRDDRSPAWYVVDQPMLPHLVTLALHGRLGEAHPQGVARGLRALLDDPDREVVAAAERFALAASGPVLATLWNGHAHVAGVRELLLANPHPVPAGALTAAWSVWLSTPDRRLWEKLAGRPATGGVERRHSRVVLGLATPAETCAAALSGGTSDVVVAHAVAVCRDRGHAPDDPLDRAALFTLTGQVDRYRALDPDSALLARAYGRAPQRLRRRLRAAMTEVDGIDPVLVLTGGDPGRNAMTAVERDYLVRQLVGREQWERLWRLVRTLPLAQAVEAARTFAGWRPPPGPARDLFDRLVATRPADVHPDRLRRVGVPARLRELFQRPPHLVRPAHLRWLDEALSVDRPPVLHLLGEWLAVAGPPR